MDKILINTNTHFYPMPMTLIGTKDKERANFAPIAWINRANYNPPMIVVLFPGKSDALRGILLAALGMVGQRAEPIEGMEIINIENSAAVAYDDTVIIIAQPSDKIQWCVKQHKGVISSPSLASSNKSFAKVSRKARQDNALTFWANVDEVYSGVSKLFPVQ